MPDFDIREALHKDIQEGLKYGIIDPVGELDSPALSLCRKQYSVLKDKRIVDIT